MSLRFRLRLFCLAMVPFLLHAGHAQASASAISPCPIAQAGHI